MSLDQAWLVSHIVSPVAFSSDPEIILELKREHRNILEIRLVLDYRHLAQIIVIIQL